MTLVLYGSIMGRAVWGIFDIPANLPLSDKHLQFNKSYTSRLLHIYVIIFSDS